MNRRAALAALLVLLGGCAGPGVRRSSPAAGDAVHVSGVPFFPDGTDQCGPSTVASILTFWHRPTTPQQLRSEIYLRQIRGTLPMDILPAVESRGLKAEVVDGTLDQLKDNLRRGRPILAYLDLGIRLVPWGHYVVVTGFDDRGIYAHSGKKKEDFMTYSRFLKTWGRTDHWMLVVDGPAESAS